MINLRFEEDLDYREMIEKEKQYERLVEELFGKKTDTKKVLEDIKELRCEPLNVNTRTMIEYMHQGRNVNIIAARRTGKTEAMCSLALYYANKAKTNITILTVNTSMNQDIVRKLHEIPKPQYASEKLLNYPNDAGYELHYSNHSQINVLSTYTYSMHYTCGSCCEYLFFDEWGSYMNNRRPSQLGNVFTSMIYDTKFKFATTSMGTLPVDMEDFVNSQIRQYPLFNFHGLYTRETMEVQLPYISITAPTTTPTIVINSPVYTDNTGRGITYLPSVNGTTAMSGTYPVTWGTYTTSAGSHIV